MSDQNTSRSVVSDALGSFSARLWLSVRYEQLEVGSLRKVRISGSSILLREAFMPLVALRRCSIQCGYTVRSAVTVSNPEFVYAQVTGAGLALMSSHAALPYFTLDNSFKVSEREENVRCTGICSLSREMTILLHKQVDYLSLQQQ